MHRDLKLENILLDTKNMQLKILDFGFACYGNIDQLNEFRGTDSYMAPEIKAGMTYNGIQVDIFSAGVILFIIVNGIFPFRSADPGDYFFDLLVEKNYIKYWNKISNFPMSAPFKDLMQKLLSPNGSERPSIAEIRQHEWFTACPEYDFLGTKNRLKEEFFTRQQNKVLNGLQTLP